MTWRQGARLERARAATCCGRGLLNARRWQATARKVPTILAECNNIVDARLRIARRARDARTHTFTTGTLHRRRGEVFPNHGWDAT